MAPCDSSNDAKGEHDDDGSYEDDVPCLPDIKEKFGDAKVAYGSIHNDCIQAWLSFLTNKKTLRHF
jgi:hypothetical protein